MEGADGINATAELSGIPCCVSYAAEAVVSNNRWGKRGDKRKRAGCIMYRPQYYYHGRRTDGGAQGYYAAAMKSWSICAGTFSK